MGEEPAQGQEETSDRVQGSDKIDSEGEEVNRVVLPPILKKSDIGGTKGQSPSGY